MYEKQSRRSKVKLFVKLLIGKILFSIFLGGCYYFYHHYKNLDQQLVISEQTLKSLDLELYKATSINRFSQ